MEQENKITFVEAEEILALSLLEDVIQQLSESLERYSRRSDANQFYIQRQNEILFQLSEVHGDIKTFNYLPIWRDIEKIMARTEEIDSQVAGHAIFIRTRLIEGDNYSYIDKYWSS